MKFFMKFSQRIGKSPIKANLEREGISPELLNSLWSLVLEVVIKPKSNERDYGDSFSLRTKFYRNLWIHFFKKPIDNLPTHHSEVAEWDAKPIVREWFFGTEWYNVFDFIEFCVSYDENRTAHLFNNFLKKEMSAYRFIGAKLVEVTSDEEIAEIESAIKNTDKFSPVKTHLKRAIDLYSDRNFPDYRNSIKESISAVESIVKIIIGDRKATLGQALNEIQKKNMIPGGLKAAFSALYGYTSEEGGIRHALLEEDVKVDIEEARFMLISCSAFVNYLISKV